jgi:hypothetical protein
MDFRALPGHLIPLAETAARHFAREYGIQLVRFKAEAEISPDIPYRPTLHAQKSDGSIIAIDVSDLAVPAELNSLILGCKNHAIPLKLWVAVPYDGIGAYRPAEMHFIRENGLGLVELHVDGRRRQIVGPPLALSLTGLRAIRYSDFPARYRDDLRNAYDTFVNGNPAKGCSLVYDELEALTRRICKKAQARGLLNRTPNFNVDTEAWNNVLAFLRSNFNRTLAGCPDLTDALLSRLQGLTEYRNEAGHKPKSLKKLMARDKRLRTRFEAAIDELQLLVDAAKPLKP